jgi:Tfp pilus assembly protein PilN
MIRINLAPVSERRGRGGLRLPALSFNLGVLFGIVYLVVLAGLGAWWWTLSGERARLAGEVSRGQQELAALKTRIAQAGTLRADVADMRQRVQVIETLMRNQGRPILLFDAFADMLPRDLWITGMEEKNQVLKLSGTAFSPTAVADLMSNLRASGRFKEVDIVIARQDLTKSPRLVTFEVTCRFES